MRVCEEPHLISFMGIMPGMMAVCVVASWLVSVLLPCSGGESGKGSSLSLLVIRRLLYRRHKKAREYFFFFGVDYRGNDALDKMWYLIVVTGVILE